MPTTSVSRPQFAPATTPAKVEFPELVMLPNARGVPALGRTRTFCHVIVFGVPPVLLAEMVNVSCVEVTDVMANDVPLTALLMFFELLAGSPVILTVGAVPPVSKMNPVGAFRMTVPTPALPVPSSV